MKRHVDAGIEVDLDDDIDPETLDRGAEPRQPGEVGIEAIEAQILAEMSEGS